MASYFLTNKAIEDLSEIWEYTYEVWSENQANKYYLKLLKDCQKIADEQSLGKNYMEINNEIFGYKSGQHLIFYRKLNSNELEITRFLHSKMDLKNNI